MTRIVYGVVRSGHQPVATTGVAGAQVDLVSSGELAAAVSDAPEELLARRRDVTAHMDVLDELMRHGPVLPFRFGTVVADDEDVRELLTARATDYTGSLDALDDLVQVTLHLTHDEEAAVALAMSADRRLREFVRSNTRRGGMGDRIAVGERVAASVAEVCGNDQTAALEGIGRLAQSTAVTSRTDTDLAVSFLVKRDRLSEVDAATAALASQVEGRARLDYAGPMPAYSFVG